MIVYKSKLNIFFLLIFSIFFLGLGVSSVWINIYVVYKVILFILMLLVSAGLLYTFVFYMRSPKEVFEITDSEITIFKRESKITYQLKDIKEVSFNFNVPYLAIAFTFSIIMHSGDSILFGFFVSNQIKVYRLMREILTKNNIKIKRDFYL